MITLVFTAVLAGITVFTGWQMFGLMANEPNLPIWWKIPTFAFMAVAMLLFSFLIVAIPMYVLSPIVSYLWLVITFALGPVRKLTNTAEISQQGISKSFEQHNHVTPWSAVYDLVETKKSLLIFTNRNCAMMIPKAGFATIEQVNAFWSAAQNYWQKARAVAPSAT